MRYKALLPGFALTIITITSGSWAAQQSNEPIQVIAPVTNINPAMVELGKKLFFDPRLSKSGFISCNSCHNLSLGGTDNIKTSIGHNWNQGPINAPTVLNASLILAQFWDGRAKNLKAQAGGPIANPGEMASTHELAIEVLQSIPGYVTEYQQIFGNDKINIDDVTSAIAEFEKTLVTPNSRFDKWLMGDNEAINDTELAGYKLFKETGCTGCHNGPAVGGTSYQKMGLVAPYQTDNKAQGRFDVTGNESDRLVFKVPSLRNIELTYPYFHDGGAATLREAVDTMGRIQLGKQFTDAENIKIVAFLKTLTGDQPAFNLPILPPSSDKTPQPMPF
ncbi:MAG: cytochrome-c peroxidase [Gammaproteobacteria bacterium]|nr:cytochrome-c peroxidase [Gammaproteobacteria bacterium]